MLGGVPVAQRRMAGLPAVGHTHPVTTPQIWLAQCEQTGRDQLVERRGQRRDHRPAVIDIAPVQLRHRTVMGVVQGQPLQPLSDHRDITIPTM